MSQQMQNWIGHLGKAPSLAGCLAGILACLSLLLPIESAIAGRLEAGTFSAHNTISGSRLPVRVNFQQAFDTPPIVVAIPSRAGSNSASIRITNVTTTGFDELILEPDAWDGRHLAIPIYYIAIEPGRHVLPDGTVIEAGFTSLSNVQFGSGFSGSSASWRNVTFSSPLSGTPAVLHQLQTANSETRNVATQSSRPHITSIVRNPGASGFDLAIERSQANSGPWPSTETIGWIAFPTASSGSFPDISNNIINWNTVTTGASVRGWDDGCVGFAHGLSGGSPIVVAKKTSRNNPDGGWFRYCSISATGISLVVDEDTDQDRERTISTSNSEQASMIAFSQSFHALLKADLTIAKAKSSTNDGLGGDFDIPGAEVDYLITVTNIGNSPPNKDSVAVVEQLPTGLNLVISGYSGPATSPVLFEQGSPSSNLTCPFVSLASTTDCVSFSTDGSDFSYVPTDSGDGTDPAVRYVRVIPSGFMLANTGSGAPNFGLRLKAKVN